MSSSYIETGLTLLHPEEAKTPEDAVWHRLVWAVAQSYSVEEAKEVASEFKEAAIALTKDIKARGKPSDFERRMEELHGLTVLLGHVCAAHRGEDVYDRLWATTREGVLSRFEMAVVS